MDTPKGVLLQVLAFALLSAGVVILADRASRIDRFASPSACLRAYIRAVLAVDEERELATATLAARANAERQRGPDKAKRKRGLAGKARLFRERPIRWTRKDVKFWAERARINVTQGSLGGKPLDYTYSFLLEKGEWKIANIEYGWDIDFR
ncbi:MAG: hypothetical protein ACYS47_08410 [Planctomycetota bacterium]